MVDVATVIRAINTANITFSDERELHRSVAAALESAGVAFEQEVVLDEHSRIDLVAGNVGIELKVAGATADVLAQVMRYSRHFDDIVVVTTVLQHRSLPTRVGPWEAEANVHVVYMSPLTIGARRSPDRLTVNHPDGTVTYGNISVDGDRVTIEAAPHVTMRLRRLFPRASSNGPVITLTVTPDVASDIEWVLQRWPLVGDPVSTMRITELAETDRVRSETIAKVLAGSRPPGEAVTPARPPRWPHQELNANLIAVSRRLLITDRLGAGKTYSGSMTFGLPDALPGVVVCPVGGLASQWVRELEATWPTLTTHIARKTTPYDPTTIRGVDRYPDVMVVPYSKLAGWRDALAGVAKSVVFDEVQELRNGTETARGSAADHIAGQANYVVGLSATPIHNYGGDIFNVMSIIRPGMLGTRSEFLREHCGMSDGTKPRLANPEALASYLSSAGAMIGSAIESPAPLLIEHTVESDRSTFDRLAGDAAELARFILSDAPPADRWRVSGDFDMKMRQATGLAKAPYVATFVRMLLESVDKVLLFGWHRAVYQVWLEHLEQFRPVMYTGTESPTQKAASVDRFVNGDSRVLIMSLASGAGLDGLQVACNTVVFGELDWSPAVHNQAVGRLNRPGQPDPPVAAYFLVSDSGADPTMVSVLGVKEKQSAPFEVAADSVFTTADSADRIKEMARDLLRRGR